MIPAFHIGPVPIFIPVPSVVVRWARARLRLKEVKMQKYRKAIVAFLIALATWAAAALTDGKVSATEWAELLGVAATTFGVYMVPNTPAAPEPAPPAQGS